MIDKFKETLPDTLKLFIRKNIGRVMSTGKQKIFGIGYNKTGTTSLKSAMHELGYIVGSERQAKFLFNNWVNRDFKPIIEFSKSAQFFQDSPYSLPYTFILLDQAFPKSKFILTVRDSGEQWYHSLINFHGKLWGNGNIPPTIEDLKNANSNVYKGRPYHTIPNIFNVKEDDPYNKEVLIKSYYDHINNVNDYFRHRNDSILILNVAEKGAYSKLCEFLCVEPVGENFPWKNKTQEVSA